MEKWETILNVLFYRSDCPDVTQLRNYQFSLLDDKEKQVIDAHTAICTHCAAELAGIAQFMQTEATSTVTSQPSLERKGKRMERIKRTLVAVLQPSDVEMGQVAFRSGDAPQSLWYEADNIDINLEWRPDDSGRYRLFGQVFGLDEQPDQTNQLTLQPVVTLAVDPIETTLNKDGAFMVGEVKAGTYQLTIRYGDDQVVIPAVTISQLRE